MNKLAQLKLDVAKQPLVQVIKPGIVFGNAITVLGGYFLAAKGHPDWLVLFQVLIGTMAVIASGCVINNIIDRDIDSKMQRTCDRVLVTGQLSIVNAFLYAAALLAVGVLCLAATTPLALYSALFGYAVYVGLYSLYFKRQSVWGTFIGSFSGAIPPVIGYAALTPSIDAVYWVLFAMFAIWQMPHAYAIAVFREKDYSAADIPVLPVKYSFRTTQWHITISIALFVIVGSLLTAFKATGYAYLAVHLALSGYWLWISMKPIKVDSEQDQIAQQVKWAYKVFGLSIVIMMALCFMMGVNYI
ncbi:heme o synthase [Psychrobacter arenosus]|uniref:heme o synthase n=1 Tax=Psychrobacter arenosus TaxID=256326 RepID=UPI002233EB41|nr:heme o synthase [Psychrobacter arenosus]